MSVPFNYVAQGWQCPVCHHVYSPSTPQCYICPVSTTTSSGTIIRTFDGCGRLVEEKKYQDTCES